jgi:hypothetical protein
MDRRDPYTVLKAGVTVRLLTGKCKAPSLHLLAVRIEEMRKGCPVNDRNAVLVFR